MYEVWEGTYGTVVWGEARKAWEGIRPQLANQPVANSNQLLPTSEKPSRPAQPTTHLPPQQTTRLLNVIQLPNHHHPPHQKVEGKSADDLTRPSTGDMAAERASGKQGVLSVDSVGVAPKGSPIAKIKGSGVVAGKMRAAGARDYSGDGGSPRVVKGTASRASFASGSLGTQL